MFLRTIVSFFHYCTSSATYSIQVPFTFSMSDSESLCCPARRLDDRHGLCRPRGRRPDSV